MEQVGRWNTFVSLFPMKYSDVLVVPELPEEPELLDDPDEPEEPEVIEPDPEPVESVVPLGKVSVTPLVENTTSPFLSVLYTDTPAAESLLRASEVGWPYVLEPTQITPYSASTFARKFAVLEYLLP